MSRLKKLANNKLNRQAFKQIVLDNGFIPIDQDGMLYFVVTQVNTENFTDMTEKLEQQLNDEGKYDSWIGFISFNNQAPYSIQSLPIYGNSQRYVTDYFTYTAEDAINQCLNDRAMGLLKRANAYRENNM